MGLSITPSTPTCISYAKDSPLAVGDVAWEPEAYFTFFHLSTGLVIHLNVCNSSFILSTLQVRRKKRLVWPRAVGYPCQLSGTSSQDLGILKRCRGVSQRLCWYWLQGIYVCFLTYFNLHSLRVLADFHSRVSDGVSPIVPKWQLFLECFQGLIHFRGSTTYQVINMDTTNSQKFSVFP